MYSYPPYLPVDIATLPYLQSIFGFSVLQQLHHALEVQSCLPVAGTMSANVKHHTMVMLL